MSKTKPQRNKLIVLRTFERLFNRRNYATAETVYLDRYIRDSAHIAPGRDGLFDLIRSAPDRLRYENQPNLAEGDYVIAKQVLRQRAVGRPDCSGRGSHRKGGFAESWDVLQDRVSKAESVSGCRCSTTVSLISHI